MSQQATMPMPTKKKPGPDEVPRRGRPKGAGRITSRYSIVTTPEYQTWMAEFLAHLGETEISDVYRDAIRSYADKKGFRLPPAR